MKSKVSILLCSALLATTLNASGLTNILNEALDSNPAVKERLQNYEKTVYDLKIAKSAYQPTVDYVGKIGFEKTFSQVGTAGSVGLNTYQNSLILTQNLFNGLKTTNKIKYEEARVMASAFNYVEKTNDVAFNVVRNYIKGTSKNLV